jgi:hypothetical protein
MNSPERSRFLLVSLVALAALVSGCATVKDAPLKANAADVDVSGEALVFLTARLSNAYKPSYPPKILVTFVQATGGSKELLSFRTDEPYDQGPSHFEHLVAFKLAPGSYQVRQIRAMHRGFPIMGMFEVPIYQTIEIKGPGAYYLGRVEATIVERKDDKLLRAGSVVPLIDQAVVGASGGTFEVKIADRFDEDMRILAPRYPAITKVKVDKVLLKPWRQPTETEMQ